MISEKTLKAVVTEIVDWCDKDNDQLVNAMSLIARIRNVEGNKSFSDTLNAIWKALNKTGFVYTIVCYEAKDDPVKKLYWRAQPLKGKFSNRDKYWTNNPEKAYRSPSEDDCLRIAVHGAQDVTPPGYVDPDTEMLPTGA